MNCDIIRDLLPLYCDGVCSEATRLTVEAHIASCESCRSELHAMREATPYACVAGETDSVKAAEAVWKRGKRTAFFRGCVLVSALIALVLGLFAAQHLFSTADGSDTNALARKAAAYLRVDEVRIERTAQRGNYLAALCTTADGMHYMCEFDRDELFPSRYRAAGGIGSGSSGFGGGELLSWCYGSPQGEAVLIFCGAELPDEARLYRFENAGITYLCPIEDGYVLDIFVIQVIQNEFDIGAVPDLLDAELNELH